MFSRLELNELMSAEIPIGASLYLPTHVKGRDVRQDPIRLKNLVDEALPKLMEFGLRRPEAEEILAPAEQLIPDEEFWRHQDLGLALFLAKDFCKIHHLPITVDEMAHVGHRFRIKPLLPILADDGRFFVFGLTGKQARLYLGTKWRLAEIDFPIIPERPTERFEGEGNPGATHPTIAGRPQAGIPPGAVQPAPSDEPGEMWETDLLGSLAHVDSAVGEALAGEPAPVVLAAEPDIEGEFRRVTTLRNLVDETIKLNPEATSPETLHEMAYAMVRPRFVADRDNEVGHLKTLLGNDNSKGSVDPATIVKASAEARIGTLLLAEGASLWGRVSDQGEVTAVHASPETGDEDLTDFAAAKTLQQGGKVYEVPADELGPGLIMGAVFRWEG